MFTLNYITPNRIDVCKVGLARMRYGQERLTKDKEQLSNEKDAGRCIGKLY